MRLSRPWQIKCGALSLDNGKGENRSSSESTCTSGGREHSRDVLQDFYQATLDLHSYLSRAERQRQHDVTVPTETLKTLLDNVETIKTVQRVQEKRSVASLYFGTILGALIGIIGNFLVSFLFMPYNWGNTFGLAISSFLFLSVCVTLFLQAKKYAG